MTESSASQTAPPPDSTRAGLHHRGLTRVRQFDEAAALFREALEQAPDFAEAILHLAYADAGWNDSIWRSRRCRRPLIWGRRRVNKQLKYTVVASPRYNEGDTRNVKIHKSSPCHKLCFIVAQCI